MYVMLPYGSDALLVGSRERGLFVVDENGEYWLCDAEVDKSRVKDDCTAHGSIHMAEGG